MSLPIENDRLTGPRVALPAGTDIIGAAKPEGRHPLSGRGGSPAVGLRARATSQTLVTMSPAPPTRRIALCLQHALMLTCSASEADPGSPGNMMNTAGPQEVVNPWALLWSPG